MAKAAELWPPDGWSYSQGFAWVVARVTEGVPEAEIDHAAYYGPVCGPGMAASAAARLARDGARGPGRETP